MKVGDKVIVTLSNSIELRGRIGVIHTIDNRKSAYFTCLPYRVVLDDNTIVWCQAIPYSSLMMELM